MVVDIFCQVIDNYGDIGVCWRLAQQLSKKNTVSKVRIFVNNLTAFNRIEPKIQPHRIKQQIANITVCDWSQAQTAIPAALVIETFGCDLPLTYTNNMPKHTQLWLNLEYLSAEDWVSDLHGLPSPQPNGIAKYFFFPGFTDQTGGLLRPETQHAHANTDFWNRLGIAEPKTDAVAFVFTYPNAPLNVLYEALTLDSSSWTVLLAATVPAPSGMTANTKQLCIQALPYLPQTDFDILMDYADLNVVRGEDSFVRAIWAAKPFVWQPYIQDDQSHLIKLRAWLARTDFDTNLHAIMLAWSQGTIQTTALQPLLAQRAHWQQQCRQYARNLALQTDLATQLLAFFRKYSKTR